MCEEIKHAAVRKNCSGYSSKSYPTVLLHGLIKLPYLALTALFYARFAHCNYLRLTIFLALFFFRTVFLHDSFVTYDFSFLFSHSSYGAYSPPPFLSLIPVRRTCHHHTEITQQRHVWFNLSRFYLCQRFFYVWHMYSTAIFEENIMSVLCSFLFIYKFH